MVKGLELTIEDWLVPKAGKKCDMGGLTGGTSVLDKTVAWVGVEGKVTYGLDPPRLFIEKSLKGSTYPEA